MILDDGASRPLVLCLSGCNRPHELRDGTLTEIRMLHLSVCECALCSVLLDSFLHSRPVTRLTTKALTTFITQFVYGSAYIGTAFIAAPETATV